MVDGADHAAIADWLSSRLNGADAGARAITVPGGSTPFPIIHALIDGGSVDWSRWQIWPNDDRIVPEAHEASNTGKLRALLEPVGARIIALSEDAVPPRFALTWLGMGPDGHIASLFPNTDPKVDDPLAIRRLTPVPLPVHAPFDRITLTIPALAATGEVLFTLGGAAEKRAVFEVASAGENDLPVARLLRTAQARGIPVTVFT
mgnify:CR=1 FL=1